MYAYTEPPGNGEGAVGRQRPELAAAREDAASCPAMIQILETTKRDGRYAGINAALENSEALRQERRNTSEWERFRHAMQSHGLSEVDLKSIDHVTQLECAPPEICDTVYRALLDALTLSAQHQQVLLDRGLSLDEIKHRGYRSLNGKRVGGARKDLVARLPDAVRGMVDGVPGFFSEGGETTLAGADGLLIPVRDARGRVTRLKIRPDAQAKGKKYVWLSSPDMPGGVTSGSHVHTPLHTGHHPVVRVTEGELKADIATVLSSVLTLSVPGVTTWRPVVAALSDLQTEHLDVSVGQRVLLAFDCDANVDPNATPNKGTAKALRDCWYALLAEGYNVALEVWKEHKGIDDLLAAGGVPTVLEGEAAVAEINATLRSAGVAELVVPGDEVPPPGSAPSGVGNDPPSASFDGLLTIQTTDRPLRAITKDAYDSLCAANDPPVIFRRGGLLTWVRREDGVKLEPMGPGSVRYILERCAQYVHNTTREKQLTSVPCFPPMDVVTDLMGAPSWPEIPPISGVTACPVFGSGGVLERIPGYLPDSRLWYHADPELTVPEIPQSPTPEQVRAARSFICDELLGDFPFNGTASIAHAIGAMLVPLARPMISGPTPLILVEAPEKGTGKGLLMDVIVIPSTGQTARLTTMPTEEAEVKKWITSSLLDGPSVIAIDNLTGRLVSAALDSVLTTTTWSDRVLGVSRIVALPVFCLWIATGNNVGLGGDTSRRVIIVRIDAQMEQPWLREGFRHTNLRRWALDHRGELLGALLTMVQAWIAAGRPGGKQTLGSYESCSSVVGGILDVAGIPGFLSNLQALYAKGDEDSAVWRDFCAAWWMEYKDTRVGIELLFALAQRDRLLLPVLGDGNDRSQRIRMGKAIARQRDRVFAGYRVQAEDTDAKGRAGYRLVPGGREVTTI